MDIRGVVTPQRVREFRSLTRRVSLSVAQAQPLTDLRKRQLNGIAFALGQHQSGRVPLKRGDSVQNVVSNFAKRLDTAEKLDPRPKKHGLRLAHLPLLGFGADKSRKNPFGQKGFVELPVQEDPAPMGDAEVVAGWTFEPSEGAGCLKHLGQRLLESISSSDEGGVKIEQRHVAPVTLCQCESVPSGKIVEETAPLESLLVDARTVPAVEYRWELVEVATEQKLDAFWFVELCPKTGLDL